MASKKKKGEERTAKPDKAAKPKLEKSKGVLPKTINGVKLPKDVREKLTDLAKHPIVAELLAAGLVAVAARLKNEPKIKNGASKAVSKALDAAEGTGQDMAHVAANIAAAVVKPVVKRIRTAAAAAAAAPSADEQDAGAATPPAPNPKPIAATPPTRRPRAATTGTAPVKPRASRRAAPKPTTSAPNALESDDA
ncbi:hypothetical protein [Sphingomonas sp. S2-65]|uniref:hypothetical protein n=1 Tax=Sphingomonas sp. S2-65 TaxID=2903960 RepID=UPI001F2A918C|nr:hypothetical protein [Sphingomonas sp. S2-65]UYY59962.1 hypothetical protein LZ586_07715 [Sphingomonas sp. S2-65]